MRSARHVVENEEKPGAGHPMAMSLTALAIVLGFLAANGVVHQADEGAEESA
jgi:hypothetical protein